MEEAGVLMSTEARSLTQPLGNPTLNLLKAPQNYGLQRLGFSTGGLNPDVHQVDLIMEVGRIMFCEILNLQ